MLKGLLPFLLNNKKHTPSKPSKFSGLGGKEFSKRGLHIRIRCVIVSLMKEVPVRHPTLRMSRIVQGFYFFIYMTKGQKTMDTCMLKNSLKSLKAFNLRTLVSICAFDLNSFSSSKNSYKRNYGSNGRLRC
jgi:hypothetical protein